jgi:acetyl esterase/lipase
MISRTFAQAGYVCVSIAYRLGDRAWPTNLLDCKNAVRYLRANASGLAIDPARIAIIGCSAGAHLALMVGFTAGDPALSPPQPYPGVSDAVSAVVEMYGITDLLSRRDVTKDGAPLATLRDAYSPRVLGASRAANPALWAYAGPVNHVHPGVPPVLIIHGLADPIVDVGQARELDAALAQAALPHEMILIPHVGHEFDFLTWQAHPLPQPLGPVVLDFLARHGLTAAVP